MPLVREAAERSSSLQGWSKKRYWANVSDVFLSEPRRHDTFSEKSEESNGIKFGPEAAHLSFSENPHTRTTFLQAPFEAVLQ